MFDENLFDTLDVELFDIMKSSRNATCPSVTRGPGVKRKTPALLEEKALKLLERHDKIVHIQQEGGAAAGGAGVRSKLPARPH